MATYVYLNDVAAFDSPSSKVVLTTADQKTEICKKFSSDISFFFIENGECRTTAFQVMLKSLKVDDVVILWDWRCLVRPNNLSTASADVWAKILEIHRLGASLHFINGDNETKTAKGRYLLTLSIAGAQFAYDQIVENTVCSSSSSTGCSSCISGS